MKAFRLTTLGAIAILGAWLASCSEPTPPATEEQPTAETQAVEPKAKDPAAKTALPQPPRTSQNVPISSAPYFLISMLFSYVALNTALLIVIPSARKWMVDSVNVRVTELGIGRCFAFIAKTAVVHCHEEAEVVTF